jgi:transketolase
MATNAGEGHVPSALSILDILWVLYDRILKINPSYPKSPTRDRFILSKGHAALGLYVILAKKGFFPSSELEDFGKYDGFLGGHPDRNKVSGVEASTGSLGHGFPMSVGIALGLRIKKIDSKVFVLIGDGEANEGSVWESALLASHHNLSNLCCIIDYNHSTDRALKVGDMVSKFKSFGW